MLAKKIALGFGIAIIFPVMVHYGVSTFVREPRWEDYNTRYYADYQNASPQEKARIDAERIQVENNRRAAEKRFQKFLFMVAVPLGIAAIITGSIMTIQAVGTGLMFGGIFSLMDGYFNYWHALPDGLRFLSMLVAFIVLVFIGYRKLAK